MREWTGAWGDESKMWKDHPAVAKQLGCAGLRAFARTLEAAEACNARWPFFSFEAAEDGCFWIAYDDFVETFNVLYVCRLLEVCGLVHVCVVLLHGSSPPGCAPSLVGVVCVCGGGGALPLFPLFPSISHAPCGLTRREYRATRAWRANSTANRKRC